MKRISELVILLTVFALTTLAQSSKNSQLNLDNHRLALDGYDPVAYFTLHKAVKGKSSITVENEGAVYQFSTKENKDLFVASPASYKPQYGGWCAYAMGAKGEKVEVDPETFKLLDGKLYLFYNRFFNNTLDSWNENEVELKMKADKNWSKLVKP
jgi:YHS domain-containing protein